MLVLVSVLFSLLNIYLKYYFYIFHQFGHQTNNEFDLSLNQALKTLFFHNYINNLIALHKSIHYILM